MSVYMFVCVCVCDVAEEII